MIRESDQAAGLRRADVPAPIVPLRHAGTDRAHVVAVTSGKGGVGKTQVAANLAVGLSREGRRVLLMDADLGLASLDLALGVEPELNLLSVLTAERSVDDILVEGPTGVFLIPACPGRYDVANLDAARRQALWDLIEEAAEGFDVLIIDTGAGIGSNAVGFASHADEVLLVTTPDPTALRDAYAMAKVLHRRAGIDRVQVVANQVASERDGAQIHSRMQGIVQRFLTLDLAYLGAIPRDDVVRESVSVGQPFVLRHPTSSAGRALAAIAHRVMKLGEEARPC